MSTPTQMSSDRDGRLDHDTDEITLVHIFTILLRYRRMLVLIPMLFAVMAGGWSLVQERTYRATASFMPQAPERPNSGAAALARQFGISTGGERPGQSPQFYVELLRERAILRQAVESEYRVTTNAGPRAANLIGLYGLEEEQGHPPAWRRAVERLREDVSATVGRETGVVRLAVNAPDPDLAEQIVARLLELLNRFNLETRQTQALEEGRFVSTRMAEARDELRESEDVLKAFLQQNRQFENSPELRFEHDRLQRQVGMRQQLYTTLVEAYEQSRIDAVRDTPVLTVIAGPDGSAEPAGRGTVLKALLGFMLGVMVAVFLAFGLDSTRRMREEDRDDHREFHRLRQEAWDDLRHPARLVRRQTVPAGDHAG